MIAGLIVVGLAKPAEEPALAAAGINQTINYQGRLLTASGAVVPDGTYNMRFKIYQDGDGLSANDSTGSPSGSLKWTETHTNNGGTAITVKNGYFSVNLGAVTAFGTSVDWNQDTLWLSTDITTNGTDTAAPGSLTWNGEMLPMKRLASAVYALNSLSCSTCILQAPASTAQNTITPTVNSVVGLTVNATSGTAATAVSVAQAQAADAQDIAVSNGSGTAGAGLSVTKSGAGTLTAGLAVTRSAGTLSYGLTIGGTIATADIQLQNSETIDNATNGTVNIASNSGAVTLNLTGTAATIQNSAGNLTLDSASNTLGIAASDTTLQRTTSGNFTVDLNDAGTTKLLVTNSGAGAGVVSAKTGFEINGASASAGHYLRGDGTNYVDSTIQGADIPTCTSGCNYISNGTTQQTANYNIIASAVGNIGAKIQSATSGTAAVLVAAANTSSTGDIFQLQDASGSNVQRVDTSGNEENLGYFDNAYGGIGAFGNLLINSEALDQSGASPAWTRSNLTSVTADDATNLAPDGQASAEKIISSGSGTHSLAQACTTGCTTNSATYTFSMWVKADSGNNPTNVSMRIDWNNGGAQTGTAATFAANGTWQRVSVTQAVSASGMVSVTPTFLISSNSVTVYGWGAQLIVSSKPSVYVRTVTAQVAASSGVVSNGGLYISAVNASDKPLIVQAAASASADQLEFISSGGTVNSRFDSNANLYVSSTVDTQGNTTLGIGQANATAVGIGSTGSTTKGTDIHINDTTSNTNAQTVTLGSKASNTSDITIIQGGSNTTQAIQLTPNTAGGILIGATGQTGQITVGQADADNTIAIGSTNRTSHTQTINIGGGTSTTSGGVVLNLATGAPGSSTSNAVHIADGTPTGTGTNAVTIGTLTNASTTTIQGGTGATAVAINSGVGGVIAVATAANGGGTSGNITLATGTSTSGNAAIIAKSGTNSTGAFQVQNASNVAQLNVDTSVNKVTVATTASGGTFQNNGSSVFWAKDIGNQTTGTLTASTTVDIYTSLLIPESSSGQDITIPAPTDGTAGHLLYVANTGTQTFTLNSSAISVAAGSIATLMYNGSAWKTTTVSTGVNTVGAFSGSSQANGASISGNTITFGPADTTNPGMLSTSGTQTISGDKVFKSTTSSATAFQLQNSIGGPLFNADASVQFGNKISNPGGEAAISSSDWPTAGFGTGVTQARDTANIWSGAASVSVATGANTNSGGKNVLNATLASSTPYSLSFMVKGGTAFSTLNVDYLYDGTNSDGTVSCTGNSVTTSWNRITCSFTTSASGTHTKTSSNAMVIYQSDATSRTYYLDGVQLRQVTSTFDAYGGSGAVRLDGVITSPVQLENSENSTRAFTVQNSAGGALLTADTTSQGLTVNSSAITATFSVRADATGATTTAFTSAASSSFTVPNDVASVTITSWGAGGGGGAGSGGTGTGGNGGGGGFAKTTVPVTPGESLTVEVGTAGAAGASQRNGGNGGGYSGVKRGSAYLVQAGGGGGGGGDDGTNAGSGGAGGAGGGTSGVAGSNGTGTGLGSGGGAGTNLGGGTGGTAGTSGVAGATGAANVGGEGGGFVTNCTTAVTTDGVSGSPIGGPGAGGNVASCEGGGGGGGGRFGGGGGGSTGTTGVNRGAGGGGGGSDYVNPFITSPANTETAGSGTAAGGTGDGTYASCASSAGVGGNGSTTNSATAGKVGCVVLSYTTATGHTSAFNVETSGGTDLFRVATNGDALFQNSTDNTSAFQIQNSGGTALLAADTTNMNVTVNGNLTLGKRTDSGGTTADWSLVSGAAGSPCLNGATSVDTIKSSVTYNGSLYIGTSEQDKAEICRYDGGTTWTRVNSAAGTFGANANTDRVDSMAVYDGYLYIGTTGGGGSTGADANTCSFYRYDGGSTFTLLNTQGQIDGGITSIDTISSMAVYNGALWLGTSEPTKAQLFEYKGGSGGTAFLGTQSAAGEFDDNTADNTTGPTAVDTVSAMAVWNGLLYIALSETGTSNRGSVVYYNDNVGFDGFILTSGSEGQMSGEGAIEEKITALTVYDNRLYAASADTSGGNSARVWEMPSAVVNGANNFNWVQINSTAGTFANATDCATCATGIDEVSAMTVYNGNMYISTKETNSAEVYQYKGGGRVEQSGGGGSAFTRISSSSGTIKSGGTSSIDNIPVLVPFNDLLFVGDDESNSAQIYTFSQVEGQSRALVFDASSDNAGSTENASYPSQGSIFFAAEQSGQGGGLQGSSSGVFEFSHSIVTGAGAYDVAEDYATRDGTLKPGDLVAIDMAEKGFVRKASGVYDPGVVGVYSENPALRLSQKDATINGGTAVPVALAGRVPLNVSTENGNIMPGDPLTSSSVPGVAMKATKAGRIVGMAMEAYSGVGTGKVMAFVNPNFYSGTSGLQASEASGDLAVDGKISAKSLDVSGTTTTTDLVVAGKAKAGSLAVEGEATVKSLVATDSVTTKSLVVSGAAQIADLTTTKVTVNGDVSVGGDLHLGKAQSKNAITKEFMAEKDLTAGQVVAADPSHDGQVTTTKIQADTKVVGVVLEGAKAGEAVKVAIGGTIQVRTGGVIEAGDLLSTSTTEGVASKLDPPQVGAVLGKALGKPDANGLVWILVALE